MYALKKVRFVGRSPRHVEQMRAPTSRHLGTDLFTRQESLSVLTKRFRGPGKRGADEKIQHKSDANLRVGSI